MTSSALDEIEALAQRFLTDAAASPWNAAPLAHAIMQGERAGIASYRLIYLPVYAEHLACGKVEGQAILQVDTPRAGVVRVDTGTGLAHPAIAAGMTPLLERARQNRIACLTDYNSCFVRRMTS